MAGAPAAVCLCGRSCWVLMWRVWLTTRLRWHGLNPPGIDLNFGCPAKVVNRHGGGAALLDEPELVAAHC
jgi:hypothetical protein